MHIKRKTIGKLWPIPRTGSKYLAVPTGIDKSLNQIKPMTRKGNLDLAICLARLIFNLELF